jgi:hypothetical protein
MDDPIRVNVYNTRTSEEENVREVCIQQYSCYRLDLNEDMVDQSTGTLTQQCNAYECMLMAVYKSIHM